ncbi:MAG: diadenylate cyclase [Archaeoglobaceae archaeon]
MLEKLLRSAEMLARELGIGRIAVITKEDIDREAHPDIIVAPKKYATLLDSVIYYLEESPERVIMEKFSYMYRTREYLAAYMFLSGFEVSEAVVVIDTESLKGVTILDPSKSHFLKAIEKCAERVNPLALRATLMVAMNIAYKGREGKKIGTAFVMGDVEEVLKRSSQLILNPFQGHKEKDRDIKNPEIWESVMEFAQIDGVFVLDENGLIVSAGRYIEASPRDVAAKLKYGLGGRHLACAAITKETEAIAIVVSESGGDVTVYKDGVEVLHIPSILY